MKETLLSRLAAVAGVTLILKVTLILAAGFLIAAWLRRRSAATRHLVWLTVLVGALALAALAPIAPRLSLDVRVPSTWTTWTMWTMWTTGTGSLPARALPGYGSAGDWASPRAEARRTDASLASPRPTPAPSRREPAWPLLPVLGALWLAGLVAVLLWSAVGHIGLWSLERAAIPVERGAWMKRCGAPPPEDGAAGRARLGLCSAIGTPLTWGWRRPIVLLPSSCSGWPIERRRAALLHELAHVSRGDYLAQAVATLTCAVYWFHPLVWWGAKRLRAESEHACDDVVLAAGTPAAEYARDLLEVARDARAARGSALVAIGMARRSNLEGRLLAVLDEARARGVIPSRASVTTLAVAMLLLLPVTGLEPRFTTAEAKDRPHGTVAQATPREDALTADEGAPEQGVRDPGSDDAGDGSPVSEKSLSATPGGLLELDLETGGAVEIQGWDRREVSVRSRLAGSDWRGSRVEVTSRANGVRVHCFQADRATSYTTSHEFQIRVPSAYDVRLRSAGGDVAIADVSGSFRGSTGGGHLQLERDRGQANLTTGGGDIEVSDSHLAGAVTTGGGTVRLSRVRGGLRGSSGSGPVIYSEDGSASTHDGETTGGSTEDDATGDLDGVRVDGEHERIRVGDDGAGFLHIHKAGGGVDLDDAPSGAEIRTGGGAVRVRHGRGSLSAHTGGGDIEIGPIAGSVSAGTGAGDVHVILASIGGDQQSVDIWSGTGNVVVELPEDLNARFEVETAFTESFRRQARITSEWSLERDAITGWDDSQGTRRRHVRARGLAGDGKGLIRIKTVNGDIQLRRVAARATER